MRQNGSCFIGKRGTFQNASEMRQKCVKNARNTFGGEHLSLIFLAFLEKSKENHPKKQGFFFLCWTPKIRGKEGKNAQKSKEIPCKEKSKEIQKSKERKIWVWTVRTIPNYLDLWHFSPPYPLSILMESIRIAGVKLSFQVWWTLVPSRLLRVALCPPLSPLCLCLVSWGRVYPRSLLEAPFRVNQSINQSIDC